MEGPGLAVNAQTSQPHVGQRGWQDHLTKTVKFPSEESDLVNDGF